MKLPFRTIFPILFGLAIIASGVTFVKIRAASEEQLKFLEFCKSYGYEINSDSPYSNFDLNTEDVMELYHKTLNTKFNEYIKKMIKGQAAAVSKNESDPNALPPEPDANTGIPGACEANNYSTYCVASTLLSDKTFGYMEYRKSLLCRKQSLFSNSADAVSFMDVMETTVSLGISNPSSIKSNSTAGPVYQAQKALEVSARLQAIDTEVDVAKQALDKTLVAYEELKTAWPMHKRYIQIYESLVKYRDKLVEIRHHAEDLPSKFIDATTTKCT